MTDFRKLLSLLAESGVEFILVGGAAATAHGSARLTVDLDIVYSRSDKNVENLVKALSGYKPYLRGAPKGLPFVWDSTTLKNGLNFTLTTLLGDIDLLGEITGGGTYENLKPKSVVLQIYGLSCRCLSLDQLIWTKRAAGRPKDLEAIAELEIIQKEKQ